MKRSCAPAASSTRPSRRSCWTDPSRSIPSSAHTSMDSAGRRAFIKYFIERRVATSRRRGGRAVEGVRHGAGQRARSTSGDLTAFVAGCSVSRGCSVTPSWRFRAELIEAATLNGSRRIHRRPSRPRSRDPAAPAAAPVASHRVRVHVREDAPHSIAHPHLAAAGRSAACGRHGQPRAGEAVVRRVRRACAGRSRQSLSRTTTRDAREPTSSGTAARRSRCSTWRSPGPSSTATSTWRTSCSTHGAEHQHQLELP